MFSPSPPPKPETWATDERRKYARADYENIDYVFPDFRKSHPVEWNGIEEDTYIWLQIDLLCLTSLYFPQFYSEEYFKFTCDEQGDDSWKKSYELRKKILQILFAENKVPEEGFLLCKSPFHALYLKHLFHTFPDVCMINCHRSAEVVVPSYCKLIDSCSGTYARAWDRRFMGKQVLRLLSTLARKSTQFRKSLDREREKKQFFDVSFKHLVNDPIERVKQIYSHFGLEYTGKFEEKMRKYLKENPQGKHGRNNYSLQEFGLNSEEINELFSDYNKVYSKYF